MLGLLRPSRDPASEAADLEALVADSVLAGVPVSLHRTGPLDELPSHVARTLWRPRARP